MIEIFLRSNDLSMPNGPDFHTTNVLSDKIQRIDRRKLVLLTENWFADRRKNDDADDQGEHVKRNFFK